jgi:tetratricopeptide (TPR) repeat protein
MDIHNLTRFTPSMMTPGELEATFVQREDLLQAILERIATNALTSEKHNMLLVGPRGIGKTHLTSLIYYRLKEVEELNDHMLTAWLREEEWNITCFRDLLFSILSALLTHIYGNEAGEQRMTSIRALESKDAETAAAGLIRELVGDRTLVILAESFDELIQKLGNFGGMQLYSFMRENDFCSIIATSASPITRVLPPGSPFGKGFFQIQQLQELSFNDSIQLISKIAGYQGNRELTSLIATSRGRARIRALRYLAGGNHRAYVVFAPLLAQESLGKLIKLLVQTLDELAPFFSSRIAGLSEEQKKIIEFLCESRRPVQIADVAEACATTPASTLAQLDSLCKMGYLQSFKIRDARYYELRELLMRLSFEVKKHRSKPIGLLLDFLRLWYSPGALKQKAAALLPGMTSERNNIPDLRSLDQYIEDPAAARSCREYNDAVQMNDYGRALQALEKLVAMRDLKEDRLAQASCFARLERVEEALAVCDGLIASNPADAAVWQLRALIQMKSGQLDEALFSCRKSIEMMPDSDQIWCDQASILLGLKRPKEAVNSCERAIRLDRNNWLAWEMQGRAFSDQEMFDEAVQAFSKAVELHPQNLSSRMRLSAVLVELNRFEEALVQARQAIEINPEDPQALALMGSVLASLERFDESLLSFNKAISLGNDSSFVQYKVVEVLLGMDRWREGIASLDRALGQFAHLENADAGDTRALIRCLLPNLFAPRILQLSIKVLFLTYQKHRMLGILGQGLIECIPDVISSAALNDTDVNLWRNSWQMIAGRYPEFRLPLRLLDSAARYRKTRDLRIFMDLPQEERKLLEQLTGVQIETMG